MELREILASVRRQWAVALIGILVTVGLGVGTVVIVPPTYQYEANIVLLPPRTSVDSGGNPYLLLGGLSQPLDVLSVSLQDQTTTDLVHRIDKQAEVTIAPDANSSGPILVITAEAPTAAQARAARDAVAALVPNRLLTLQNQLNILPRAQITSMVLTADQLPQVVNKARLRAAVAVVGLGLVASLLVIAVRDGRIGRRGTRRSVIAAESGSTGPTPTENPVGPPAVVGTAEVVAASPGVETPDDAAESGGRKPRRRSGRHSAQPAAGSNLPAEADDSAAAATDDWSWGAGDDSPDPAPGRARQHASA